MSKHKFSGLITNEVPDSVFDLELAGPTTDDYDRIQLVAGTRGTGTFYASGILNVTAINAYKPIKPTSFQLIEAEGGIVLDPAFDTINLPWLGTWDTSALYTDGEISFTPYPMSTTIIIQ